MTTTIEADAFADTLAAIAKMVRRARGRDAQSPLLWASLEELVLHFGRVYTPSTKPRKYPRGRPKACFVNSAMLAIRHDLIYVEGFARLACVGLPIHHGWCVKPGSEQVIDVTATGLDAYIGIPFQESYLREHWRRQPSRNGCATLIDQWQEGWPLLRMSEAELRERVISR